MPEKMQPLAKHAEPTRAASVSPARQPEPAPAPQSPGERILSLYRQIIGNRRDRGCCNLSDNL